MKTKQHKRLRRMKAEMYAKIIKYISVILAMYFVGLLTVPSFIVTTVWMTIGDIAVYLLELKYKITHDYVRHR